MKLNLQDSYGYSRNKLGLVKSYAGELEFIIKDKAGRIIEQRREPNIVKIQAKEILSHRTPYSKVWDYTANSGTGGWVSSGIDPDEEYAAKYFVFGASFDDDGAPLDTTDSRYYTQDVVTGGYVPITLGVGAEYDGGLVNAVPISDPDRPVKKVERIYYESSYQPAGTPLLQDDVRALNNILVLETTLRRDEYNGFGQTASDYFTITEVALAAGIELGTVGACEADPHTLFLEGNGTTALAATANGTATVTLDPSESSYVDVIKEGDTIKIVDAGDTAQDEVDLDQVTPYYLVISKTVGGSDIVLDRTPVDMNGDSITGSIGVFRDSFRIFSHRILSVPLRKGSDFEITVRWRIIFN